MKILLAIYLFFLFVFVHGMEQSEYRSGNLVGIWKCVGKDTARNLKKPFAFFNEDGTGNWLVDVFQDRAKIDSRFKFTVFSQVGNTYKIRWENEKKRSTTRDVVLEGDTLFFEGEKWLQKLNIDGSALVGTWKCVGWDEARCIGKFVFFNKYKDGSGFWLVESPDRGKIDPSFKYLVDQRDDTHYTIHWFNEYNEYGTVNTVLIDDKLLVDDGTDENKLWLQKLNKKEENGNEIILENITWDLSDELTVKYEYGDTLIMENIIITWDLSDEKIEDNTEGNEEFIWHVINTSKILNGDYSITPLPLDFEKQINRLYKSAPYMLERAKISEEKCWWLVLHGNFKTSHNPFNYRIPISPKRIDINVQPGEMELNKILNEKEKKSLFSCCCPGKKESITYKKK